MLSGTQSKIDTQNQKKTVLEYKQERLTFVSAALKFRWTLLMSAVSCFGQTEQEIFSTQAVSTDPLFTVTDGSNAVVTINGVDVERSTNSFTVDGISINLLSETDTSSTITVTQDTDKIYDTVVKFIDDYNTLINSINELLDADATHKDYAPLTSAQEEEMTESQIEKWETKAKEGLLRNDRCCR